ncbi:MAG: baseplate J/gp47 family protein [Cyanobacteriota bacterium]
MSGCACGGEGPCTCGFRDEPAAIGDPLLFRHSAILARMRGGIAATRVDGASPLADWTSRDTADPGIALLDAQAVALHVLAWNLHRLWADGTLPASEDAGALGGLARLLGHAPRPALSAVTVLSLDLDDLPGAPETVELPLGLKVASLPSKDELPQTFETDAPLVARKAWNRLTVQRARPAPPISTSTATLTLEGSAPQARAGDLVLVWADEAAKQWLSARIVAIDRPPSPSPTAPATTVLTLTSRELVPCPAVFAAAAFQNQVILLGDRASAFGATAPDLSLLSTAQLIDIGQMTAGGSRPSDWRSLVMTSSGTINGGTLDLAAVHGAAMAGKAVLFAALGNSPAPQMGQITDVWEGARRDFGLSAKVSRIAVTGINLALPATATPPPPQGFANRVRETAIHIETARERLALPEADASVPDPATPDRVVVLGEQDLEAGRLLILLGRDWTTGARGGEVVTLRRAEVGAGVTTLVFTAATTARYHAEGLEIHANCVSASQGETLPLGPETLGSGTPGGARPRFRLNAGPVAQVPAPTPRGHAPALVVRVGGGEYVRADSLLDLPPQARVYRFAADTPVGTLVEFPGPLPAGQAVTAAYRTGGGPRGNVAAGRLTTVLTPVPGLRGATNPFAASGGTAAESPDDLRRALPASVRTLGRAVAREDFEAFALDYRGVGKALATELRQGMRRVLCLTIADSAFQSPRAGSSLPHDLRQALLAACPPGLAIRVEGFDALTARVALAFAHDPALERVAVEGALRLALRTRFSPAARPFGEALHRAQVLAAAQAVPGLLACRLTHFALVQGPAEDGGRLLCPQPRFEPQLAAAPPLFRRGGLIAVAADDLSGSEMAP